MIHHVVITGCSGGGKSTLIEELARRGHRVVPEPGWRIVREQMASDGAALPWVDPAAFARRAIELALLDKGQAPAERGWVFFDRSVVDAVAALQHSGREQPDEAIMAQRYHRRVFFAPPWPEIFRNDPERRHDFGDAIAEHDRLLGCYARFGYETIPLPKVSVGERADFVLANLA